MFRKMTLLAAFGTLALGIGSAAAGDYRYGVSYGCEGCEPFYVVNQGPSYAGPGIVVSAGYHDLDPELPVVYPYVGPQYWYRPYDGGPYADPIRHVPYHRYRSRYYWPAEMGPGPQIIHVGGRARPRPGRAPRYR